MSIAQKAKGPASVGALPSHGSNFPDKENPMNTHIDTTAMPVGASRVPGYTVDDIIGDATLLHHLLGATTAVLLDMHYGKPDGGRNVELDRVNALVHIAADSLSSIIGRVEANYGALIAGEARA